MEYLRALPNLGWLITTISMIVIFFVSIVTTRIRMEEKNRAQDTRLDKHSEEIDNIEGKVGKTECRERRDELKETMAEIKGAIGKLDTKFDKYILNGRR